MSIKKLSSRTDHNNLTVINYLVFGWIFHVNILPTNSIISVSYDKDLDHDRVSYRNFYTKGKAIATHENPDVPAEERIAGQFSLDRKGQQRKGLLVTRAVEDTEIWCINYHVNKKNFPTLVPVILKKNETYKFNTNDLILLCTGKLYEGYKGPEAITNITTVTAEEDTYLWVIDRIGPNT